MTGSQQPRLDPVIFASRSTPLRNIPAPKCKQPQGLVHMMLLYCVRHVYSPRTSTSPAHHCSHGTQGTHAESPERWGREASWGWGLARSSAAAAAAAAAFAAPKAGIAAAACALCLGAQQSAKRCRCKKATREGRQGRSV
eukprot:836987-Pelagomonas_calceolata.AAC.2